MASNIKKKEKPENNKSRASRSVNWSQEMKEAFRTFVEEFSDVVNSKENNARMIKAKKDAWRQIGENMASVGYNIEEKRLKETWIRIKGQARMKVFEHKKGISATGGGEAPTEPDDFDYKVLQTDVNEVLEDSAEFDGDAETTTGDLLASEQLPMEECDVLDPKEKVVEGKQEEKIYVAKPQKRKSSEKQQEEMLNKRIRQIEDEHAEAKKIRAIQIQIECTKLEVEEARLEAIKEEREFKRKVYQAKLSAQQAKKQYYLMKTNNLT